MRERNELLQILADSRDCACLQLRTPMKRVERNRQTVALMVAMLLGDFVLELLFVYQAEELYWTFVNGGLLALVFFFAFLAGRTDPGFLQKPQRYSFS